MSNSIEPVHKILLMTRCQAKNIGMILFQIHVYNFELINSLTQLRQHTINHCWEFRIDDSNNPNQIKKAMDIYDTEMEAHKDMRDFFYDLQFVGGSVAIKGNVTFIDRKDEAVVIMFLLNFGLRPMQTIEKQLTSGPSLIPNFYSPNGD